MAVSHGDFSLVFWVAVLPAVTCVLLVAFGVEELETTRPVIRHSSPMPRMINHTIWRIIIRVAFGVWRAEGGGIDRLEFTAGPELLHQVRVGDEGTAETWASLIRRHRARHTAVPG